ncbi:MAG: endonuclease/exonuclease/phosphatase family protein [Clostridiales bacterium]|nr:endonuclease/exonuclease/phosphatase family protein [Clostridiales bacterium]
MKKTFKVIFKIIAILLAAVILVVGGYFAYVFISFHRIGNMDLEVHNSIEAAVQTNTNYKIVSYNIGFGAYESDYGFFMDGGDQSWAWSEERLDKNLKNISNLLAEENADLYFVQEVDIDSTRSYHFDERDYLTSALGNTDYTFAQNYDSPFLCYPFTQPHGASKSGLMVFSDYDITSAQRVELPIESGFTKLLDLDRCYSKNRIKVSNGKELVAYNFHLSAYTSDGTIANEQLELVLSDVQKEYEQGNYCIVGGDFNKDILGDSSVYFGKADKEYTWAQPIPDGILEKYDIELVAPLNKENPVPTCRNADSAYHEGQYVLTIDGFIVTPNVSVTGSEVIDTGFAYSDHNPVSMNFTLK